MPSNNMRLMVRHSGILGKLDPSNSHADHDKYVCRWHSDTDASMAVYDNHAYCYGCGKRVSTEDMRMLIASEKGVQPTMEIQPTEIVDKPAARTFSDPPQRHGRLGLPTVVYAYQDAAGQDYMLVYRFDMPNGGKEIRQLKRIDSGDTTSWAWGGHKNNRPLYNLQAVTACTEIIVAEGEKSADAINNAIKISGLRGITATTPSGGSNAPRKTNWLAVAGKRVYIWPDNDAAGFAYATEVAALCNGVGALFTRQFEAQHVMDSDGDDAADITYERVVQILETRNQWQVRTEKHSIPAGAGSVSTEGGAGDFIMEVLNMFIEDMQGKVFLFRDKKYMHLSAGKHAGETLAVNSDSDNPLTWAIYEMLFCMGKNATSRNVQNVVSALKSLPAKEESHVGWRYALHGRAMYVNYAKGIQLKISESKWMEYIPTTDSPVSFPPLQFGRLEFEVRSTDKALRHYIDKHFFSVPEYSRPLVAAWICLAPFGAGAQQPILNFMGESGSGKTSVAIAVRNIVDPHSDEAFPTQLPSSTKEAAFLMSMSDVHIFDNVSKIQPYMSDFLCTMVTGGSFVQRKLFTDDTPHRYRMSVGAIITSLDSVTGRADLIDRLVTIPMHSTDSYVNASKAVEKLKADIPEMRLLMMHIATKVLWDRGKLAVKDKLTNMRMVEWMNRAMLAATYAGYTEQEFADAITASSDNIVDDILMDDVVLERLQYVLTKEGAQFPASIPVSQLLEEMKIGSNTDIKKFADFPTSVDALGKAIALRKPLLRRMGFYAQNTRAYVNGVRMRIVHFSKIK